MVELDDQRMSVVTRRFVVRPNDSFRSRLRQSNEELAALLQEAMLWTHSLGGRTLVTEGESMGVVKLVHLGNLVAEYSNDVAFERLMGNPQLSTGFFDTLWEIYPIDDEASANVVLARLPNVIREQIEGMMTNQPS